MSEKELWKKAKTIQYKYFIKIENNSNLLKEEFGIEYGEKIAEVLCRKWEETLLKLGLKPEENPIGDGMPIEFLNYINLL